MKLKESHGKLKDLLRETITLLCKSGLEYKFNFNVDAVIGITLDGGDGFYVTIQESVQNENCREVDSEKSDSDIGSDADTIASSTNNTSQKSNTNHVGASKRKQKSSQLKRHIDNSKSQHLSPSKKSKVSHQHEELSNSSSNFNMLDVSVKEEPDDCKEDLIFVKTELSEPDSFENSSQFIQSSHQNVLSGSDSFSTSWCSPHQPPVLAGSFELPSHSRGFSATSQQIPSTSASKTICPLCAKMYRYRQGLKDHMRAVHGIGNPYKCVCGETFVWRMTRDQHKKNCEVALRNPQGNDPVNEDASVGGGQDGQQQGDTLKSVVDQILANRQPQNNQRQ